MRWVVMVVTLAVTIGLVIYIVRIQRRHRREIEQINTVLGIMLERVIPPGEQPDRSSWKRRGHLWVPPPMAGIAAVGVWVKEHPTATAVTALATLGGIFGLVASTPWGNPQPRNPPIALPAPGPTVEPVPVPAPPAPGVTRAPSGTPRPAAPITDQPINAPHRTGQPSAPTTPPGTPPTTTPTGTPSGTPPPSSPPSLPPSSCTGVLHVDVSPILELCALSAEVLG